MHLQRYAGIGRANSVDNYNFRVNYIFVTDGRRDRKLAQTRLALLTALRERLAERPLEEINVRELAEAADVSEATFYNHFPTKTDLAIYFVQLWSVDTGWHTAAADRHTGSSSWDGYAAAVVCDAGVKALTEDGEVPISMIARPALYA